jgi:hypothetical protein
MAMGEAAYQTDPNTNGTNGSSGPAPANGSDEDIVEG